MFEAQTINTDHKDVIHDIDYDYYGDRMATCSSDQFVKVWDADEHGEWQVTASWKAHSGSVWKVTWAHPEFGQVIATCSFDRTAAVWEEVVGDNTGVGERSMRRWVRRTNLVDSRTSVTDVKFAPKLHGLLLATCSADGVIRIYEAPDVMNLSQWSLQHEVACKLPLSCLSWNQSMFRLHPPMIAVGSDDVAPNSGGKAFIYEYSENARRWSRSEALTSVTEPVHDIAFAPDVGRNYHTLAIATNDVRIVTLRPIQDAAMNGIQGTLARLEVQIVAQFSDHYCTVWRVCWDAIGTTLASSGDDGCVRLWKMNYTKTWKCAAVLRGDGTQSGSDVPVVSQSSATTLGSHSTTSKIGNQKRVVGVLLGCWRAKGVLDVSNSFAVPFDEDDKYKSVWFLDHDYLENMYGMFKKVNARERVVGWYHTGPKLHQNDVAINELVRRYCPNSVLVIIDAKPKDLGLPTEAYQAVEEVHDDGSPTSKTFEHVASEIGAEEAEEVGVEHLLRDIKDTTFGTLSQRITNQLLGLKGLHSQIREIRDYLVQVGQGTLPVNHQIVYQLQDIFNLLPDISQDNFVDSIYVKTNDQMLVVYLAALVRSIIALHNLINNKLTNRDAEERKKEDAKDKKEIKDKDEKDKAVKEVKIKEDKKK